MMHYSRHLVLIVFEMKKYLYSKMFNVLNSFASKSK